MFKLFICTLFSLFLFSCASIQQEESELYKRHIRDTIRLNRDQIKVCYDKTYKNGQTKIYGKVRIYWEINGEGKVQKERVVESTLNDKKLVSNCLLKVVQQMDFAPNKYDTIRQITFPFVFKPN